MGTKVGRPQQRQQPQRNFFDQWMQQLPYLMMNARQQPPTANQLATRQQAERGTWAPMLEKFRTDYQASPEQVQDQLNYFQRIFPHSQEILRKIDPSSLIPGPSGRMTQGRVNVRGFGKLADTSSTSALNRVMQDVGLPMLTPPTLPYSRRMEEDPTKPGGLAHGITGVTPPTVTGFTGDPRTPRTQGPTLTPLDTFRPPPAGQIPRGPAQLQAPAEPSRREFGEYNPRDYRTPQPAPDEMGPPAPLPPLQTAADAPAVDAPAAAPAAGWVQEPPTQEFTPEAQQLAAEMEAQYGHLVRGIEEKRATEQYTKNLDTESKMALSLLDFWEGGQVTPLDRFKEAGLDRRAQLTLDQNQANANRTFAGTLLEADPARSWPPEDALTPGKGVPPFEQPMTFTLIDGKPLTFPAGYRARLHFNKFDQLVSIQPVKPLTAADIDNIRGAYKQAVRPDPFTEDEWADIGPAQHGRTMKILEDYPLNMIKQVEAETGVIYVRPGTTGQPVTNPEELSYIQMMQDFAASPEAQAGAEFMQGVPLPSDEIPKWETPLKLPY